MRNRLLFSMISILMVVHMPAVAAPEISRGAILASTCFTCHGTDGKSPGEVPSIYGVPAESMEKTLQDFKSGLRPATVMDRHAKGYNDEEIREIADYLSKVK